MKYVRMIDHVIDSMIGKRAYLDVLEALERIQRLQAARADLVRAETELVDAYRDFRAVLREEAPYNELAAQLLEATHWDLT